MFRVTRLVRCVSSTPRGMIDGKYKQTAARVEKTNDEWKAILSEKEYTILRMGHTDSPSKTGYTTLLPKTGYFQCSGCGTPLYSASSKFVCFCGWPSFSQSYKNHVNTKADNSVPTMPRTEILCAGCDGHLGHVFIGENLCDTNERHCVNSTSIHYTDAPPPEVSEGTVAVQK